MKKSIMQCCALILALITTSRLAAQDVYINLNQPRQGVDGAGFCHEGDRQNGDYYIINAAIQQMLDNNMTLFRDMFPNKTWEPSKGTYNYTDARVTNSFQRLKTMQDRGITTILGIWDVPNWMVSNPSAGSNRKINNFDDFAWFIYSFLKRGKDVYGLTVDYVDINETKTSGVNIALTAAEYITLIQKCHALFTANGIQTKMNMGSVLLWDIDYSKQIYNATNGLSSAGVPSWHSYRGGSTTGREPISYWENWGAWQQTLDRNLWGTETDYDAFYYNNPDRYTWQGIEEMAVMYYRNYYVARMSTSAGWYWHPEWPSNNVHTAYMKHFEPGGQVVTTSQPSADIMTVAYKNQDLNKFVIQTLNQAGSTRTVNFIGVPANKPLTLVRTSAAGDRSTTVGVYTPNGTTLTITLQPDSFNTFYGELGGTADTVSPSAPANFRSAATTTSTLVLAWNAATDNVGVAGYQVFNASNTLMGSSSGTTTTLIGLTAATSYTLVVKAYDAAGNFSGASNTITVATNASSNVAPVVSLTSPASGASFTAPATLALAANASDSDGMVAKVEFYQGATLLGTDTTSPYNFTWSNVAAGSYSLTAKATDNSGAVSTSAAVAVTVSASSGANIAYQRPVFVTSTQGTGFEGSKAVDANGTTRWASASANNQSIVVDLGANYNVNRVRLAWEAAYATDYQIQFSTNNTTWTTVREFWGKSSAAADNQTGLTGVARYVKIYCINRATTYGFSLYEFEIYGTP